MSIERGARTEAWRLSGFRAAIVVVVAVLVAQVTVVVVGASFVEQRARESVRDVVSYAAAVSTERATVFAQDANSLVHHVGELWDGGDPELAVARAAALQEVEHSGSVYAITVTYPDGTFFTASRSSVAAATYTTSTRLVASDGTAVWEHVEYDHDLAPTSKNHTPQAFDPLTETAFVVGSHATGATWTLAGLREGTGSTGVWLALPLRASDGELRAVVSADLRLDVLAATLNELPASSAQAFLLADDRSVIAAPASFADQIGTYQTRTGTVATASSIGVVTDAMASDGSSAPVFGRNGSLVTVEKALPVDVAPWVVQLRGEPAALSPASVGMHGAVVAVLVPMVAVIVAMIAVLLRVLRPLQRLRSNAEIDRLTGLNNRHGFDRWVRRTMARSFSDERTVLVLMLDLDNFKALNDRLVHDEGDRALAVVANILRSDVRNNDVAVRWGGDEFLLALAVDRRADFEAVVERVRGHVAATLAIRFGTQDGLGATAGFTEVRRANELMHLVVARADAALVEGKRRGKGMTYGYGPAEVDPTPAVKRAGDRVAEV